MSVNLKSELGVQLSKKILEVLSNAKAVKLESDIARLALRALPQAECKAAGKVFVNITKGSRKGTSYCREKALSKAERQIINAQLRALPEADCKAGDHTFVKVTKGSNKGMEYCRLKSKKRSSKKSSKKVSKRRSSKKRSSKKRSSKKSSRVLKKNCKSPKSWVKRSSRARGYCRK
jgi:hypothetical protein